MKLLAVFSAIMLPLSLIAGIYGMNFENMPELKTANGYYLTLGLMGIVGFGLLGYFWHKGWIFEGSEDEREEKEIREEKTKKSEVFTDVDID